MDVMDIIEMLITAGVAGLAAVIIQAKKRQVTRGRKMKFTNAVRFYFTEFLFGGLAGILLSGIADPVDTKQIILFGIIAGVNAEMIIIASKNFLTNKKIDVLDSIEEQEKDQLGEDEQDGKGSSSGP